MTSYRPALRLRQAHSPPIRRYADVARRLARQMKGFGFEGCGQIAMTPCSLRMGIQQVFGLALWQ